jgi:AAA domain
MREAPKYVHSERVTVPVSKIVSLADDAPTINMLVYGDAGAGKTVLAGSDRKVLFLAPEDSGTLSALRMGSKADKWPVRKWEDLIDVYEYCYDIEANGGTLPYDWLAIDSITEMQYMARQYVLQRTAQDKINKGQDTEVPQIQDWQREYIILEKMVRAFSDLKVNVIFTALSRKETDADGEEFLVPDIQGKGYGLAMKIAALMTSYGYLKVEVVEQTVPDPTPENPENVKTVLKRQRTVYWSDTGSIKGKDRTLALAPSTTGLTLQKIRQRIQGYQIPTAAAQPAKVAAKTEAKKPLPAKASQARLDPDSDSTHGKPADTSTVKGEDESLEIASVEA